jgi:hypothetical protein
LLADEQRHSIPITIAAIMMCILLTLNSPTIFSYCHYFPSNKKMAVPINFGIAILRSLGLFGNLAIVVQQNVRPMALRPHLSMSLPLSDIYKVDLNNPCDGVY